MTRTRVQQRKTVSTCLLIIGFSATVLFVVHEGSHAEKVIALDPLRSAVNGADLVIHGTLTSVRRHDVFVRTHYPMEGHPLIESYFDTGEVMVNDILWGRIASNPVPICFASSRRSSYDPRTRLRSGSAGNQPSYSSGDSGLWFLEPSVSALHHHVLVTDSYHMIRDSDPQYERAMKLLSERRDKESSTR